MQKYLIAGSFIIEPLRETLSFWIHEVQLECTVRFAPYNQLFQSLLAKESAQETAILLVRESDLSGNIELFLHSIEDALQQGTPEVIILLCPEKTGKSAGLKKGLAAISGAQCLDVEEWTARYKVQEVHTPDADTSAHIPYTEALYALLGTLIARLIYLDSRPLLKLIAVDADNTLWEGVAAEGAVTPHREFQKWLSGLQSAGIGVAVLSKNSKEDVLEVFKIHPEMELRKEQIAAWYVDWGRKELHLQELITKLNISSDSVLFIDDNPVECAAVESSLPGIAVLQFQQELFWHVWDAPLFPKRNAEDQNRVLLYQQHLEREAFRESSRTLEQFFSELNLEVMIAKAAPSEYERISQLTQRTNQFNACRQPLKYGMVAEYSGSLFAVHVKDRFGDYGLVGAVFAKDCIHIEQFLLSCRVLGRGIEHEIVRFIGREAKGKEIFFSFKETAQNLPVKQFLESLKPKAVSKEGYLFKADALMDARFIPDQPLPAVPQKIEQRNSSLVDRTALIKLTTALSSAEQVQRKLRKQGPGALAVENHPLKALIISSMEEALNIEGIDSSSHFFTLGGDSFAAASLAAKLKMATGKAVDILHIFDHPTADALCKELILLPQTSPDAYPATEEQLALWHGICSTSDPSFYQIKLAFKLKGSLDPVKLDSCIQILRGRHTSLSCDVILPNGLFTSDQGLTYALEKSEESEWIFHLQFHHLIADEQSITLFITELATLYNDPRPHLKQIASYKEYALKQNHSIPSKTLHYWKEQMRISTPPIGPLRSAGHIRIPFPASLYEAVLKKSKEMETTPFILLLAAFARAYFKVEQRDSFVIGVPFTTRSEEACFGLFVNTLPLQFSFDREPSFQEQIKECKSKVSALYAHRHTPFYHIREALNLAVHIPAIFSWNRRIGQTPVFQGVQTKRLEELPAHSEFDLNLIVEEEETSWTLHFQYAAAAYEELTINSLYSFMINWLKSTLLQETWIDLFTAIDPKKFALDDITYGSLNALANKQAHALISQGVTKGCGVAVCMEEPVDQIIATIAVLKTGGYFIPLDSSTPLAYRQALLDRARPKIVLEKLDPGAFPSDNPKVAINGDDIAYQLFTSGSTGEPKSVKINHKGLAHRAALGATLFQLKQDSRVLSQASPSFDMHIAEWGLTLACGALLYPFKGSPAALASFMQRKKISHAFFTPSYLNAFEPQAFSSLRYLMLAGEAASQQLIERWQDQCTLFNGYGPAECTLFTHMHPLQKNQSSRHLGAPIPGIECQVLDEQGMPVPEGAVGELWVKGIGVSNGFYQTQDLVRLLPKGEHAYVGRKCDLLKIHGCRLDPFLIASKVLTLPSVKEAVVLPKDDASLACYFTAAEDLSDSIRSHLRASLPSYMVPASFHHMLKMPLLPSGKIDRSALSPSTPLQMERPLSPRELKLGQIWEKLLKQPIRSPQADFFQLGGDSLSAVHLILAVEKEWRAPLRFHDLLQHSTLEELARWLDSTKEVHCLVPFCTEGTKPSLILFHPSNGLAECYRPLLPYFPDHPLYGIEKHPSFSDDPAEMAAYYAESILRTLPNRPCILGGWSLGGQIAIEAAPLLEKAGVQVQQLLMIDSFAPENKSPTSYSGPVHLIRSSYSPKPNNGWDMLSALTITELPIKHEEMFNEENIATVAAACRVENII